MSTSSIILLLGALALGLAAASPAAAATSSPMPSPEPETPKTMVEAAPAPAVAAPRVGWFLGQSTRILGNLGHVHVGMGTEFGVRWRNLAIGASVVYRPASWSRHRQALPLPDGQTYRGQSTVQLGEQLMFGGLLIAPSVPLPRTPWLTLDVPVMIGVAFLGTPLMGADRHTPDGRRVSEWENELMNGRDTGLGFATDVGLRARLRPTRAEWFHVVLGVHYLFVTGYDNPIGPDPSALGGVSGSLSIVLGHDPAAAPWAGPSRRGRARGNARLVRR